MEKEVGTPLLCLFVPFLLWRLSTSPVSMMSLLFSISLEDHPLVITLNFLNNETPQL
ncbi:hypothetical protein BJ508DRAFT_413640 [Ascobolus immersus RN42]|uniref:Uncharacterized protein n=1 Tax=Ascobolus immersus RN42 TaxID=1160509 RepID=A0A3N4IGC1_ASCIM|nr:hypothetical protein BJ508DRAFT_413640 [Ascobolus immersus RN42]